MGTDLGIEPEDCYNVFASHVCALLPAVAESLGLLRAAGFDVHVSGSGPGLFVLASLSQIPGATRDRLDQLGITIREAKTLAREDALAICEY